LRTALGNELINILSTSNSIATVVRGKFNIKPELMEQPSLRTFNDYHQILLEEQQRWEKDNSTFNEKELPGFENELENHRKREVIFLETLDDIQLQLYSEYIENTNKGDNIAKIILSFRKLTNSLDSEQLKTFIALYNERSTLVEKQQVYSKKKDTLLKRKEELDKIEKIILNAIKEAHLLTAHQINLQKQHYLLNLLSDNAYTNAMHNFQQSLTDVSRSFYQNAERIRSLRNQQEIINALKGIENAIRGF